MFCPKCKAEYREGFFECADCKVPLVEELPSQPERDPEPKTEIEQEPGYTDFQEALVTFGPADIASIKSILETEDIPYFFQGEEMGQLYPFPTKLMVGKEHIDRVKELLSDFKSNPEQTSGPGDEELERMAMAESPPDVNGSVEEDEGKVSRSQVRFRDLIIFCLILALAATLVALYYYARGNHASNITQTRDSNQDGKPDEWFTYENGIPTKSAHDTNFDGRVDVMTWFRRGIPIRGEQDANFDGKMDIFRHYKDGLEERSEVDLDFDGKKDATYCYRDGQLERADYHPRDSKVIMKRELFKHGRLTEALLDKNGDGKFDERVKYDIIGEPVQRTPLKREDPIE